MILPFVVGCWGTAILPRQTKRKDAWQPGQTGKKKARTGMRAKELIKERFGEIMTNKTAQSKQILEYMRQGNSITPLEALNLFGCMRLGARIYDLSQAGHVIHREMVHDQRTGKKYASYRLLEASHA